MKVISEKLTLNIYSHVLDEVDLEASDKIADKLYKDGIRERFTKSYKWKIESHFYIEN